MSQSTPSPRVIILVISATFLAGRPAIAESIWKGTSSSNWATPANWTGTGIPGEGDDIVISDSTDNFLSLDDSHSIGNLKFGGDGNRTEPFEIIAGENLALTCSGGLDTSDGSMPASGVALFLRGRFIVASEQTWTIGGSAGTGLVDRGVALAPLEDKMKGGLLELEETLHKEGSGQLLFIGVEITGDGDLICDDGSLKFNAGSSLPLSVRGSGAIVMQDGSLLTSQNSGSFAIFERPIVMEGISDWEHESSGPGGSLIASPVHWNGDNHHLKIQANLDLTGSWSGSHDVTIGGDHPLALKGESLGFTGRIVNSAIPLTLDGSLGGNVLSDGGFLTVNANVAGDIEIKGTTAILNQNIGGNLVADVGARLRGEPTAGGGIELKGADVWVDPSSASALTAQGQLSLSETSHIVLAKIPGNAGVPTTFPILKYGSLSGDLANLDLAGGEANYRSPHSFSFGAPGQINLTVTPGAVTWTGSSGATWDVNGSTTWSGTSNRFFNLDAVLFPDIGDRTVNLSGMLYPGVITFANASGNDYTLEGSGTISGGASIDKTGAGTVILGGAGAHDYTGSITVRNGTLKMGSARAFGYTSGIEVRSGAQVDINGQTPGDPPDGGPEPRGYKFTLTGSGPGGAGALVNTGSFVQGNAGVKSIVLGGDATIACTNDRRFDIGFSNIGGFGTLEGNHHTLTVKTTTGPISGSQAGKDGIAFRGRAQDIRIVVETGMIWAESNDDAFGGAAGEVVVKNGAKVGTYGLRTIATPVTLNEGATLHNQGGAAGTWTGPITLAGDASIEAGENPIIINGPIGESGAGSELTKEGDSILILGGDCSYTGLTTAGDGTLLLNGHHTGAVTVDSGATLGGTGTIAGTVTVSSGAFISPGESTGTLHTGLIKLTAGSRYVWEPGKWTGNNPGSDWDLIQASAIQMSATSGNKFRVNITGTPKDFNGTPKTFVIATSQVPITGFNSSNVTLTKSSFTGNGTFTIQLSPDGKALLLLYNGGAETPFATWASANGLSGGNASASADPDGDGIENLREFALDGNPGSGSASRKIAGKIASVGGEQVFTLTLPVRAGAVFSGATALSATVDGITYTIEGCDAPTLWDLNIDEVTGADATAIQTGLPALTSPAWTYRTFRSPGPINGDPSDFLRARIN